MLADISLATPHAVERKYFLLQLGREYHLPLGNQLRLVSTCPVTGRGQFQQPGTTLDGFVSLAIAAVLLSLASLLQMSIHLPFQRGFEKMLERRRE